MASYSIMTVNMNGSGTASERRDLLSKIISANGPSLVFCQELPDCFKTDVVQKCKGTCYDFVHTGVKAAVMWSKANFQYLESVDVAFKTRILDTLVASQTFSSDVSEITARTAVVKLRSNSEACSFLAVSWHGPYKTKNKQNKQDKLNKQEVLKALILFLQKICRQKDVFSVIIGGDFNLKTFNKNVKKGLGELNVPFEEYDLSSRALGKLAKEGKRPGRPYIAYKDNFVIITISRSEDRPFGDMELSGVRPVSEFNFVKEDGKDILDHDPIIGVLQFGQTPSAGKFWLSST